jgi:hypothetical protein
MHNGLYSSPQPINTYLALQACEEIVGVTDEPNHPSATQSVQTEQNSHVLKPNCTGQTVTAAQIAIAP